MVNPNVPQAAPEAVAQPTQPVVESTPQAPVQTPQQTERAAVYDKYNQYASLYQPPQQPQAEPTAPTEPAPVVEPTPATPEPSNDLTQLRQAITELQEQNRLLMTKLTQPTTPTPEPPVTTSTASSLHPMQQWLELMAANKLDEAEQFFLEAYGPKFAAKLQPQMVQQSVEANRAEVAIERFVTEFEANNQDLLPLRDYVALGAERRLEAARNEKKITDPASFVREYQKAVTDEANALREKFQLARGAGKQEALTTRSTVLSATTLPPNPISQGTQQQTEQPVDQSSPMDYMAMRQRRMLAAQGFGSTN